LVEPLADKLIQKLEQAKELYYRLVLLVAPAGSGKTATLRNVHERTLFPLINVNLELSRRMLDLTERQRILQLPRILSELMTEKESDVVLLDNIEILFDVRLKQDPLRLLQGISRNVTVVAALSACISTQSSSLRLIYATPDHSEYKNYPVRDFLVVNNETIY